VLGGRFALLTSQSSECILLPATLPEMMNSPEDRYLPRYIADFARGLRWFCAFVSALAEPTFIAVTSVHQELLPTPLAFAIARSRSGAPFPILVEVFVMASIIEILRESALRLPSSLSQSIAIVGALVIGQSVVQAGLISTPVIVIVSITALCSFAVPQYEMAMVFRILRFPGMFIAAVLGLYGVAIYFLFILLHLCQLRSFGVAYLAPLAPWQPAQLRRVIRVRKAANKPSTT